MGRILVVLRRALFRIDRDRRRINNVQTKTNKEWEKIHECLPPHKQISYTPPKGAIPSPPDKVDKGKKEIRRRNDTNGIEYTSTHAPIARTHASYDCHPSNTGRSEKHRLLPAPINLAICLLLRLLATLAFGPRRGGRSLLTTVRRSDGRHP